MRELKYSCEHLDFNKSFGCQQCEEERKLASIGAIDMAYVDDEEAVMKWIESHNEDMME